MLRFILSGVLIVALIFSASMLISRRKKAGVTGVKTALTPICLYFVTVINLIAYWFKAVGVGSWLITIALLIAGGYFTKYLPVYEKKD